MLRGCEDESEAVSMTAIEAVESACKCVDTNRKNAALSERNTEIEAVLMKARSLENTMRELLAVANRQAMATIS